MNKLLPLFIVSLFYHSLFAQISGSLMQHPDVSDTQICFVYGDDVWIAPKSGGMAIRLSSPAGPEFYPRFSPDGTKVAYSANYEGNIDVYVISIYGGIPQRLTYHDMPDQVLGWTPDGKSVLFASARESGRQRFNQFYTVNLEGGQPEKLPVPYGEFGSFSPDGKKFAYTDKSRVNRNWKRYRGGMAADIYIFDLSTYETKNITSNAANDELPMWIGDDIFYMSDAGGNNRNNLWKYNLTTKEKNELTDFKEFDITFPEGNNKEIVFEAGGKIYLYNIASGNTKELNIQLVSDEKSLIPTQKNVASYYQDATIAPDGNRVIVQARGDLFSLPATEGYVANLTATSGVAERFPAWSPDGKTLAYWSDSSGEYQLVLKDLTGKTKDKTVTNFTSGFRYHIFWSPDSEKIVYVDQTMTIYCLNVKSGKISKIDKAQTWFEGNLNAFSVSWSPDSQWVAYARDLNNKSNGIFVYNVNTEKATQLTSGFYADGSPSFSKDGNYLFFTTGRTFNPVYSSVDNSFIYPNIYQIAVAPLNNETESLVAPKNDAYQPADEEGEEKKNSDLKKGKKQKGSTESMGNSAIESVVIDFEGFEERVELLDIDPGNIGNLNALKDKLLFMRYPNSGSAESSKNSLNYYDFEKREVKNVISDISEYAVSTDGKKVLLRQQGKLGVIDPIEQQKIEKAVPLQQMEMTVVPKEEWQQIFNDVWRIERDYFYDPNMHGVDWELMKSRYGKLVEQANSRNDINIIIGDLIAELNASHTYNGGGDIEQASTKNVGYLGANLKVENGAFKITNIIDGAPWDAEVRSPLAKPGLNIKNGDYILAVNGKTIDVSKPISAAFQGLAGATAQLTVGNSTDLKNSRNVVVKLLNTETRLRHLAWIEKNRKSVEDATDGKIGYIYVRSTGIDGQNELIRQFFGQLDKQGFIIDERFNSGGQIPDRFIELLDRKPLAFWAVRDGSDWQWPPAGNFGPKVMLINGFSGSGGDAFPDFFRKRGLGPLIGTRTWGGLIGISGSPGLIDNGGVTVPTFRMYDPNGIWFKEGHGVDPDIKVEQDFQKLAKGQDAQLEAAINEVMSLLNGDKSFKNPNRPGYEMRN